MKDKFAKGGLHTFTIEVRPKPKNKKFSKIGGAFVNCWINFRLHEGALALAKFYISSEDWRVISVIEHSWINSSADVSKANMKYFREALKDGASFVYHEYPKNSRNKGLTKSGTRTC